MIGAGVGRSLVWIGALFYLVQNAETTFPLTY